jgi:hypothetical protein
MRNIVLPIQHCGLEIRFFLEKPVFSNGEEAFWGKTGFHQWRGGFFLGKPVFTNGEEAFFWENRFSPVARRLFFGKTGFHQWRRGFFLEKPVFTSGEEAFFWKNRFSPMARRFFFGKTGSLPMVILRNKNNRSNSAKLAIWNKTICLYYIL